jgi:hypothetical protein
MEGNQESKEFQFQTAYVPKKNPNNPVDQIINIIN